MQKITTSLVKRLRIKPLALQKILTTSLSAQSCTLEVVKKLRKKPKEKQVTSLRISQMTPKPSWREWLKCPQRVVLVPSWLDVSFIRITCPEYFDPFNMKFEMGWNCPYKSKWSFIVDHKGRLSTKRFLRER